jgi:hypothetical protein
MLSSPVYAEFHPRRSSQHGTISLASEASTFPVSPFLLVSSALFSPMAPTHLHSFQAFTHSFHRDGGVPPLPPVSTLTLRSHRRVHQIHCPPFFSFTYKLPIFYPLCFDIHACNGGGVPPSLCSNPFFPRSFRFLPFTGGVPLKTQKLIT